jgi:hypothetical protein
MADLGLYNYVKNALAQGKSKQTIEEELAKGGATPQAILDAFAAYETEQTPRPKSPHMLLYEIIAVIALVVFLGIVTAAYVFLIPLQQEFSHFQSYMGVSSNAPISTASPFSREEAIKSDISTVMAQALDDQDSNGGINGQDLNMSCTKAISGNTVFADPKIKAALQDLVKEGSGEQTCEIYAGGISLAVSAELVVNTKKWYCEDSDNDSGETLGDTLSGSSDGCGTNINQ